MSDGRTGTEPAGLDAQSLRPVLVCANGDQIVVEAGNSDAGEETAPDSEGRQVEPRGGDLSGFPHRPDSGHSDGLRVEGKVVNDEVRPSRQD